jgi:hypothetical protein
MNISRILGKTSFIALIMTFAVANAGCGAHRETAANYGNASAAAAPASTPAASDSAKAGSDIVGVYQGTTRAYCMHTIPSRCNAVQDVTITLTENADSKIGGSYRCAYGNMVCYNLNETGKVMKATVSGSRVMIRVLMPDGTSCIFTGQNKYGDINGGYTCYSGGSLMEQGMWRAKKAY